MKKIALFITLILALQVCFATGIVLPEGLKSIEKEAFLNCGSVTEITIPKNVTSIDLSAFSDCHELSSITVSTSNPSFSSYNNTLYNKDSTTLVYVPGALTTLEISTDVNSITDEAFLDCEMLSSITVPSRNEHYSAQDGILYDKDKTVFVQVPKKVSLISIPDTITAIPDYAFENRSSPIRLTFSDTLETIGSRAFAGTSVKRVDFSASLSYIAPDAFEDCGDILFTAPEDSYAEDWIINNGYDRTYRALLIANNYSETSLVLNGTHNDGNAMQSMLGEMSTTPYRVNYKQNQTAQQIVNLIRSTFQNAEENDVSLFFFAGHGMQDGMQAGILVGNGYSSGNTTDLLTTTQLRKAFNGIKGKKIVIVDACYSGGLISSRSLMSTYSLEDTSVSEDSTDEFVSSIISSFKPSAKARSATNLADNGFYVIVACSRDQKSYEGKFSDMTCGFFTHAFTMGAGWLESQKKACTLNADATPDSTLTLNEMYNYSRNMVDTYAKTKGKQTVQCYPEGSTQVLFAK